MAKSVIFNKKTNMYYNFATKKWSKYLTTGCLTVDDSLLKRLQELPNIIIQIMVVNEIESVVDTVIGGLDV